MEEASCRLYLISPPSVDTASFALKLEDAFQGGDVGCFQLRLKNTPEEKIIEAGRTLLPICRKYQVPFIINDSPMLMQAIGADGVHIGEEDGAGKEGFIRKLRMQLGENVVIGVSCYGSKDLAMIAGDEGADYISFGACYPTKTKEPKARITPDLIEWWATYTVVPCVAIGGITPENCAPIVKAGADFLAVVSSIWEHPKGPKEAVKSFNEKIKKALAA